MSEAAHLARLPIAGKLVGSDFSGWSRELLDEFRANEYNGQVGQSLVLENQRVRVWTINLEPGRRLPFHRHVLDYFWTATRSGRSRQRTHDGTTREVEYAVGETRFYHFGPGEFLLHDLENIGSSALEFVTVEMVESSNAPLDLPSKSHV